MNPTTPVRKKKRWSQKWSKEKSGKTTASTSTPLQDTGKESKDLKNNTLVKHSKSQLSVNEKVEDNLGANSIAENWGRKEGNEEKSSSQKSPVTKSEIPEFKINENNWDNKENLCRPFSPYAKKMETWKEKKKTQKASDTQKLLENCSSPQEVKSDHTNLCNNDENQYQPKSLKTLETDPKNAMQSANPIDLTISASAKSSQGKKITKHPRKLRENNNEVDRKSVTSEPLKYIADDAIIDSSLGEILSLKGASMNTKQSPTNSEIEREKCFKNPGIFQQSDVTKESPSTATSAFENVELSKQSQSKQRNSVGRKPKVKLQKCKPKKTLVCEMCNIKLEDEVKVCPCCKSGVIKDNLILPSIPVEKQNETSGKERPTHPVLSNEDLADYVYYSQASTTHHCYACPGKLFLNYKEAREHVLENHGAKCGD